MPSPIFVSSSFQRRDLISNAIDILLAEGIRNVELSGGSTYYPDLQSSLLTYRSRRNVKFLVHNYFPPPRIDFVLNLADRREIDRERSLGLAIRAIRLAALVGSPLYTVHPGYLAQMKPGRRSDDFRMCFDEENLDYTAAEDRSVSSLKWLADVARASHVRIGIENLFPVGIPDISLASHPEAIDSLMQRAVGLGVGLLLDLGHLNITCSRYRIDRFDCLRRILSRYGERIVEVHLSENDGLSDSHDPIASTSWQIEALRKLDWPEVPVVLEVRTDVVDHLVSSLEAVASVARIIGTS